jgi:GT2 family glycosyltransferase
MQKNKIGLALITCDRYNFLQKSLTSVLKHTNTFESNFFKLIVIDDTPPSLRDNSVYEGLGVEVIHTQGKEGVGRAKNYGLKGLSDAECEHIFLMEDDVEILDHKIFDLYIKAAKTTGIKHLNFGLHGNHNRNLNGDPVSRRIINYPDQTKIVLYPNILGAFSYYHIDTLKDVGLIDEQFYNALEHVDHTYQIIKAGYHPHFRWFADVQDVENYLKDIVPDHQNSKIRSQEDFAENFLKNHERFVKKNNFAVVQGYGPVENEYTEEEVVKNLQEIWKNHAEKLA